MVVNLSPQVRYKIKSFFLMLFVFVVWGFAFFIGAVLAITLHFSQMQKIFGPECMQFCDPKSQEELKNEVYRW